MCAAGSSHPDRLAPIVAVAIAAACCVLLGGCAAAVRPPPTLSDSEARAALARELDGDWAADTEGLSGLARPTPRFNRFAAVDDTGDTLASCMTRLGHPPQDDVPGLGSAAAQLARRREYALVRYTCLAEYPADPVQLGYLTAAQSRYLDNYWRNSLVPCLRGQGVTPPAPPRISRFVSGFATADVAWDPYVTLRNPRAAAVLRNIEARCPRSPAGLVAP